MQQNEVKNPVEASVLVSPGAIIVWAVGFIAAAVFGLRETAVLLGFLTLLMLSSYLWGRFVMRGVTYRMRAPVGGVYPGEKFLITRSVRNEKLLPVLWMEIYEPVPDDPCALPVEPLIYTRPGIEEKSITDGYETVPPGKDAQAEKPLFSEEKTTKKGIALPEKACFYTLSLLKWHGVQRYEDEWIARRRGIFRMPEVVVRSGDGFGLCIQKKNLAPLKPVQIVVYPRYAEVNTARVLLDMWESRSSSTGYLEDATLLRSVREYRPGDPAKGINQRLLARGAGLHINEYEIVNPDSILFLLDAASYKDATPDDFEETVSIVAALIKGLRQRGIQTGLAVPKSAYFPQTCMAPTAEEAALVEMLTLLAAVETDAPPLNAHLPNIDAEQIGKVYYVTYTMAHATSLAMLEPFPEHHRRILVYQGEGDDGAQALRAFRSAS